MDSGHPALGEGGELALLNVKAVTGYHSGNVTDEDAGPVGGGELGVNMEVTAYWEPVVWREWSQRFRMEGRRERRGI